MSHLCSVRKSARVFPRKKEKKKGGFHSRWLSSVKCKRKVHAMCVTSSCDLRLVGFITGIPAHIQAGLRVRCRCLWTLYLHRTCFPNDWGILISGIWSLSFGLKDAEGLLNIRPRLPLPKRSHVSLRVFVYGNWG